MGSAVSDAVVIVMQSIEEQVLATYKQTVPPNTTNAKPVTIATIPDIT